MKARIAANDDTLWGGESYPVAVFICAVGFFMRILLSGPVLNILGIDYGSDDAGLLGRVHPGSYIVILSFAALLFSRRNPLARIVEVARAHTAFFALFMIYAVILVYWAVRGPKGIGVIVDVHIVMPICAIVFSYAPRSWYKKIVYLFAAIAVANSVIGIVESLTHARLFPFDPEWEVLKQDYFRASALMGHPLTNASFTAVAMFVVLSLRLPPAVKFISFIIMLASLVAFGGRSALGFSLAGLVILGGINAWKAFTSGRMSVMRMITAFLAVLLLPTLCAALLYGAVHSEMGERLMAYHSLGDESAAVRAQAWNVFGFMSASDMVFGMDGDHIAAIGDHAGVLAPTSDIENPWILMFMMLGGMMFALWLGGLIACVARLMIGAEPALQLAIVEYFVISSTSNSFGRKDPVYLILAGIVVCAKQLKKLEKN